MLAGVSCYMVSTHHMSETMCRVDQCGGGSTYYAVAVEYRDISPPPPPLRPHLKKTVRD